MAAIPTHSYFTRDAGKNTININVVSPMVQRVPNPYSRQYKRGIRHQNQTAVYHEVPKKMRTKKPVKGFGWSVDPVEDVETAALFDSEWDAQFDTNGMFLPNDVDFMTYNYEWTPKEWTNYDNLAAYEELSSFDEEWF